MSTPLTTSLKTVLGLLVAFFCGLGVDAAVERLEAREPSRDRLALPQDPGSQDPGSGTQGPPAGGDSDPAAQTGTSGTITAPNIPVFYPEGGGSSGAAGDLIAVTGSYGIGTQVLYVIDAKTRQLAVYESRGGSKSARRVALVGARKIDLDLQLEGYNDDSEFDYEALRQRFERR
ncbi:MAG: hypothetical protein AAF196_09685 [Planctomycetota bacterium]